MEHVPFPFDRDEEVPIPEDDLLNHPCLQELETEVDLSHTCGYLSMLKTGTLLLLLLGPWLLTFPLSQGLRL